MFIKEGPNTKCVYEQRNVIEHDNEKFRYFLKERDVERLKSFNCKSGDILITCAGTIGEQYILPSESPTGIFNQALMRVRLQTNVDRTIFSVCFDKMISYSKQKYSNGSAIKNIPPLKDLKNRVVYLPKLEEQEYIAKFIELLSKKINLLNLKISTLKKYRKGIIHHLIKKGSLTSKIRDLVRIEKKTGLASSYGKDIGSYPFFINNDEGIEKYCDEYAFDGQYLIINTGGTASVKYYDGKFSAMSDCLILRPIAHAIGLYYFLVANEKQINTAGFQGTGLKHLDQKWFFNLKVILPNLSDAELNKLNELTEFQIENLKKKAQLIKSFKQYLLTNMFI